jgi:serine/threonine protein kinase
MTTVVTADTMALNAAMFGFAGHSVLTPHQAIQNIWWTDERIEAKVTRDFILSKLRPTERDQLFRPMFVGSDLTEDTYLDWILGRAKRIFLILVECGVSDQIFGLAEDSWEDSDLPITLKEVPRLALSYKDDDSLNKRFYNNQFRYLLRPLDFHNHIDYEPNEVVPVEYVHRIAPAAALQKWSRIHLPKMSSLIYARRKVMLGERDEINPELKEHFLDDIQVARSVEHEHIAPVLATWSQKSVGHIMTSFVGEHNLKSFIDFRTPTSMQKVSKQERQNVLLEWLHCLAHAVAYLHRKRIAHSAICPTNILIDENNKIAFADLGFLETFQKDKKFETDELYNYGAPELFPLNKELNPDLLRPPTPKSTRKFFGGHKRRKSSNSNSGSDTSSETASALSVDSRGNYVFKARSNSEATITPVMTKSSDNLIPSPLDPRYSLISGTTAASSISAEQPSPKTYEPDRKASDIFSLACVFVDIVSFVLKRKPNEFTKHRSTKLKNTNGKGSHVDTSFHNNAQKVRTWMEILENDLPSTQDQALFALPPLFSLINDMLNTEPHLRPSAAEVQDRVHNALYNYGGVQNLHCSNDDQRPASILSWTRTSTTSGSSTRPSVSSEPRIAAFPASVLASLQPQPAVTPKSAKRRPITPSSTYSSRPTTPGRGDARDDIGIPPLPPMPVRGKSLMDLRRWGHRKEESYDNEFVGVYV